MRIPYRGLQILLMLFWIPVVMVLFAVTPDKKVASCLAGIGFLIIPGFIWFEEFTADNRSWVIVLAMTQFLLLFSVPIMGARLLFWYSEFNSLSIFGVEGRLWHQYSSYSYAFAIMSIGAIWYLERRKVIIKKTKRQQEMP